jgi:hypothetical protein
MTKSSDPQIIAAYRGLYMAVMCIDRCIGLPYTESSATGQIFRVPCALLMTTPIPCTLLPTSAAARRRASRPHGSRAATADATEIVISGWDIGEIYKHLPVRDNSIGALA